MFKFLEIVAPQRDLFDRCTNSTFPHSTKQQRSVSLRLRKYPGYLQSLVELHLPPISTVCNSLSKLTEDDPDEYSSKAFTQEQTNSYLWALLYSKLRSKWQNHQLNCLNCKNRPRFPLCLIGTSSSFTSPSNYQDQAIKIAFVFPWHRILSQLDLISTTTTTTTKFVNSTTSPQLTNEEKPEKRDEFKWGEASNVQCPICKGQLQDAVILCDDQTPKHLVCRVCIQGIIETLISITTNSSPLNERPKYVVLTCGICHGQKQIPVAFGASFLKSFTENKNKTNHESKTLEIKEEMKQQIEKWIQIGKGVGKMEHDANLTVKSIKEHRNAVELQINDEFTKMEKMIIQTLRQRREELSRELARKMNSASEIVEKAVEQTELTRELTSNLISRICCLISSSNTTKTGLENEGSVLKLSEQIKADEMVLDCQISRNYENLIQHFQNQSQLGGGGNNLNFICDAPVILTKLTRVISSFGAISTSSSTTTSNFQFTNNNNSLQNSQSPSISSRSSSTVISPTPVHSSLIQQQAKLD